MLYIDAVASDVSDHLIVSSFTGSIDFAAMSDWACDFGTTRQVSAVYDAFSVHV